ncbi:MAG: hypothetical protein F6K62_04485 [Sphaerospermopsis sp. SIO1G2]|nr:hypothetical protein [Sphaerospermopsis sp. SIO1G1]NET70285.1 hypothetical protein [Sphaerospermopsis sp. SIO1G2]
MKRNIKTLTTVVITCMIVVIFSLGIVKAQTQLTSQSKVAINGIGSIKVGMNVPEAALTVENRLYVSYGGSEGCYYLRLDGKLKDVSFMVTKDETKSRQKYLTSDVIARVDIDNPKITTISGAKIGDSEARIKSLYGQQIKVEPHPYAYPDGHYLIFVPQDQADKNYRLIFETDGKRVTRYRVGKLPEVNYIEGCA